jgi:GNAT superfamily N-acetyltransferase
VSQLFYERSSIMESMMPLDESHSTWMPRVSTPVVVEHLEPAQLGRLRPVTPAGPYRRFEQFMRQGCQCYIATLDGMVVGYNWYTTHTYVSPLTKIRFEVPPGHLFLIYSQILPAWRGKGIDLVIKAKAFEAFRRQGCIAVRTTAEDFNRRSIRLIARWGGTPVKWYHYRRILWHRSLRVEEIGPDSEILRELGGQIPKNQHRGRTAARSGKAGQHVHA